MKLIESYREKESGYHPFLIRKGWQVAQLNYMKEQDIDHIRKLDIHHLTDEVFVLLNGTAVLITADLQDNEPVFEVIRMMPGITYNIPVKTWHNIAMTKGCEVLIVERSHTHVSDFDFFQLNEKQIITMKKLVGEVLK